MDPALATELHCCKALLRLTVSLLCVGDELAEVLDALATRNRAKEEDPEGAAEAEEQQVSVSHLPAI